MAVASAIEFTVSSERVWLDDTIHLSWVVSHADSVQFRMERRPWRDVDHAGSIDVVMVQSQTFGIRSITAGVSEEREIAVEVTPSVEVLRVSAEPAFAASPGDPVVLAWETVSADAVGVESLPGAHRRWDTAYLEIDKDGTPDGSVTVNPTETTTYKVIAVNERGSDDRYWTVGVGENVPNPSRVLMTGDETHGILLQLHEALYGKTNR